MNKWHQPHTHIFIIYHLSFIILFVRLLVNSCHGTTAWVVLVLEGGIPS